MDKKQKVLLHICCAPDATAVCERLAADYTVVGYFYNPNIHPTSEYQRRLANAEKVAAAMGIQLIAGDYAPEAWCQAVRGFEKEPERGQRCELCFAYNLNATACKAKEMGIPAFTTTLTISPHKKMGSILQAGQEAAQTHGVQFLERDFKKQDGFKRSLELSKEMGLYRQNYCGCRFSLRVVEHA